jgi:hypothetical protein
MRARSFDEEYQEAWSRDVLAHGLPELPGDLMEGEAVPVSWWVGPSTAAGVDVGVNAGAACTSSGDR